MSDVSREMYDVKNQIADLKDQKAALSASKKTCELTITDAKATVRTGGRMRDSEYHRLVQRQRAATHRLHKIELRISEINAELRRWYAIEDELRIKSGSFSIGGERSDASKMIEQLRNKYAGFAEDHTRVNSMRMMAASFSAELTAILDSVRDGSFE